MKEIFVALDKSGFKDVKIIPTSEIDEESDGGDSSLDSSLPPGYWEVIDKYSDKTRKDKLVRVANNIDLFLQTTFKDGDAYSQWMRFGKLPSYMRIANSKKVSIVVDDVLKLRKKIEEDSARIGSLNGRSKLQQRQLKVLDNASYRVDDNRVKLKELEKDFYFELLDFESSLGGTY